VTGAGPGGGPHVKEYDVDGSLFHQFFAYDPTFTGGVFVASGDRLTVPQSDMTHGPFAGIAVSAGPGGPQDVRLFDEHNNIVSTPLFTLTPYPGFGGGITVAFADDNQLLEPFLVTAPGLLGGPEVRVFEQGDFKPTLQFNAFDPAFRGGVYVG